MEDNQNKLLSKEFIDKIDNLFKFYATENRFREAYDLAMDLQNKLAQYLNLKEEHPEIYQKYKYYIIRLKWLGLPIMFKEERIAHMFKYHFTKIFDIEYFDLYEKFKHYILSITWLPDRDKFKKKIMAALQENNEKITSKPLKIGGKEEEPTIKNWLIDYVSKFGNKRADKLQLTQYLTNSENIKNLNREEKKRIKTLFQFYEKLKLSSTTLEGLEETIPVDEENLKGVIENGVFIPLRLEGEQKEALSPGPLLPKFQKKLKELNGLLAKYPPNSLERRAIEEEIKKLEKENK